MNYWTPRARAAARSVTRYDGQLGKSAAASPEAEQQGRRGQGSDRPAVRPDRRARLRRTTDNLNMRRFAALVTLGLLMISSTGKAACRASAPGQVRPRNSPWLSWRRVPAAVVGRPRAAAGVGDDRPPVLRGRGAARRLERARQPDRQEIGSHHLRAHGLDPGQAASWSARSADQMPASPRFDFTIKDLTRGVPERKDEEPHHWRPARPSGLEIAGAAGRRGHLRRRGAAHRPDWHRGSSGFPPTAVPLPVLPST